MLSNGSLSTETVGKSAHIAFDVFLQGARFFFKMSQESI